METKGSRTDRENRAKSDMGAKPQTERKHPDEWAEDLNPDHMAGQNLGEAAGDPTETAPSAHELKDVHRTLSAEFRDDELRQIPVVPEGQRLQQGATYVDLRDRERGGFTATGEMSAGSGDRYVPKDRVPYSLWNRLVGITDPERIPERGPGEGGR